LTRDPWGTRRDRARGALLELAADLAAEVGPHPTVAALLACAAHVAMGAAVDPDWFREMASITARAIFPDADEETED
jgi:hypothetical protein